MSLFVNTSIWYAAADKSDVKACGPVVVEIVSAADLDSAWEIGRSYRDQDFSIVDRTSFAVMRRLGIERVASLDDDVAIFRFGPGRRLAFTVVR